jgi:tetratricopeptide (TPR) repeat protein
MPRGTIIRSIIATISALLLYGLYVVMVMIYELPIYVLLLTYAIILFAAYSLNRKSIWALRGNYFYITGHHAKARPLLEKAIKAGGIKSPASYIYYALILIKNDKDTTTALNHLEKALEVCRNPVDERSTLSTMATCYWIANEPKRAIDVLENMRTNHAYVNSSTLTTLGYIYMATDDLEKALEITNLAIENDANYAAAWDNLGQIYFKQDDAEKAKEAFSKALSLKEALADSNYFMGILKEAAEYFRKASISPISFFNTITQEQADEKYNQYHS